MIVINSIAFLSLFILPSTASADIALKTIGYGVIVFLTFFTLNLYIELIYLDFQRIEKEKVLLAIFAANAMSYHPSF